MKVYYDNSTSNITIEGYNKMFSSGSLEAFSDGNNVYARYKDTGINEFYVNFNDIQTESGASAGGSAVIVVDYLNEEFNKGLYSGQNSFNGINFDVTINSPRIKTGDVIILTPINSSLINDILFIKSVSNGSFVVSRVALNIVNPLISNLTFNWMKI